MMDYDYCVITFASSIGAIQAQQELRGQVPFQIMPVLREISLGCGISVRFVPKDFEQVQRLLAQSELAQDEYAFYGVSGHGSRLSAQPLTVS